MRTMIVVFCVSALAACASSRQGQQVTGAASSAAEPQLIGTVAASNVVRVQAGAAALAAFEPEVPAVTIGGECRRVLLPRDGVETLSVHFPSTSEPQTMISVTVSPEGDVVRYSETRGVPKPAATIEEIQERKAAIPSTHVQLDYVTGEALAMNQIPGETTKGIRGTVADFENSATFGDLRARAALVREVCAGTTD